MKVSCNFEGFFENISLQDTVIEQNLHLITRYSYFNRKVSNYKMLLLISVSRYSLQDTKIRYYQSLKGIKNNVLAAIRGPCYEAQRYEPASSFESLCTTDSFP